MSKLYDLMQLATIERQIEDAYNVCFKTYFKNTNIEYPYACDGLIDTKTSNGKTLKLLIEYKYNMELSNKVARAKIIAQVLFYLKQFENDGEKLPNMLFIAY